MITSTYPVTLSERGWANAERDRRLWYLIERDEVIGLTAVLQASDDIISIYEADS